MHQKKQTASLSEVHESVDTTKKVGRWKKMMAFLGPAYLVSVGYMDPGNWATDLQGGAQFGYQLIWVLLMSNLMALLLQGLSARLGIVRRLDLAQANRETYPKLVNICLYILAELAIAACDLAEVLGMAIGIHLLTGIPILYGVLITVLDTFLLFYLQQKGIKRLEAFIIALVLIIGLSFLFEILFAKPDMGELVKGFIPGPLNDGALYIAVGIIGATVMPHNLYLHSALVQTRLISKDPAGIKQALKYNRIDTVIALNAAFFVNAAILVLAASVFYATGNTQVARIEDAHKLLSPILGSALAPILFAVALIAAGQSSTVTGTMAGQIVMEGYLRLRINPWVRRLITRLIAITPAVVVILITGDENLDDLLILSQVILSMQLGFAIIPLIHFVSDKKTMGEFVIKTPIKVLAWIIAGVLITLNVNLVFNESYSYFTSSSEIWIKALIILAWGAFIWLFCMMTFLPVFKKKSKAGSLLVHEDMKRIENLAVPKIQTVAVSLDFSVKDEKVIAYAISQGHKTAKYVLMHVVETASTGYLGDFTDDLETRKDQERLDFYCAQLKGMGYHASGMLGYRNRVKEIVRMVEESKADLLILGAHKHTGIKDLIFGETVNTVRHKVNIPVLIVN